jgi:Tfp pilus assembly protein FimT
MDKRTASQMKRRSDGMNRERGFSMLQLVIAVAITGIVSTFALIGIAKSRDHIRLQTSVRKLASYLEKARLDSIRRHPATASEMAGVVFTNTTTYTVKMDFDGTGNVQTRSFTLEDGISVSSLGLPSVSFNWRGRTSSCTIEFTIQNSGGDQSWVDVSDSGDVTVNNDVDVLPTVSYANVNSSADVATGTVVSGSTVRSNSADCTDDTSSSGPSTPAPPITGTGTSCTMTANPSSLSVKKNGSTTGSVTISTTGSGNYTITPSGPTNLQISPTSKTISGGGSTSFSIKSLNNTRSTFAVNFGSSCTTVTVAVKVTN